MESRVRRGAVNIVRHIENLKKFGITPVVAINQFVNDTDDEIAVLNHLCKEHDVRVAIAKHWAEGGAGATELAELVQTQLDGDSPEVNLLYPDEMPLAEKIETVAKEIYRADHVEFNFSAARSLKYFEQLGYGNLPVCIAKTQYSFSTDPTKNGAPMGHTLEVREARLSAGAGFVVAVCGDIMTMPGLPKNPSALNIGLDKDGQIVGLA